MPQIINTNINSLNAQRNLNNSQSALQVALQRLSSGLRINSAKDDAAGMAIVSRMTAQISGLNQAARNANDGISLAQTAEGDLAQIGNNLQRMRELAVQAANGTNSAADLTTISNEIGTLSAEITRVADASNFNGIALFTGIAGATTTDFQVGPNTSLNDKISISSVGAMDAATLLVDPLSIDVTATGGAALAVSAIDAALGLVNTARATLGATQNRFTSVVASLQTTAENLTASRSRIQDADFAAETASMTRGQILQQAGTAILAQANSMPNMVLALLK